MGGDPDDLDQSPPPVRASDAERESVVDRLGTAVAEGRLTLAEFRDRAGAAYAATTRAELAPLLADLPATGPAGGTGAAGSAVPVVTPSGSPATPTAAAALQHVPVGAIKRAGRWQLAPATRMAVGLGPVKLDLSGAEITGSEVDLHVRTGVGAIKVWVPAGVRVVVDGSTTVGTRTIEEDSATGPGPLVRLHVDTWIGTVKVYRT